jgi:hypothetical protein
MSKAVTHKGYEIRLTDDFRFAVKGEGFAEEAIFSSLETAKATIDKTIHFVAKKKTLALPIMNGAGKEFEITGINLHTDEFTTKPPTTRSYSWSDDDISGQYYPRVETLKPLIAKVRRLRKELAAAEKELENYQITKSRGRVSPERYPEALEELMKEHAETTAAAEKLGKRGE